MTSGWKIGFQIYIRGSTVTAEFVTPIIAVELAVTPPLVRNTGIVVGFEGLAVLMSTFEFSFGTFH